MTHKEYKDKFNDIRYDYHNKVHHLRKEFVKKNAKYKIGDFIQNVTGIIKVETISYEIVKDEIYIAYFGKKYKKRNGVLTRTNDWETYKLVNSITKVKYDKVL